MPKRRHFDAAITYLGQADDSQNPLHETWVELGDQEPNVSYVGKGGNRQVLLPPNAKYGILVANRSSHQAVGDIIIDGKFQGKYLVNGNYHH